MKRDHDVVELMPRQVLNRHWVWIFLWYGAGIFLARHLRGFEFWLCAVAAGTGLGLLWIPVTLPRRAYLGAALLCLGLGSGVYGLRVAGNTSDPLGRFALTYPRRQVALEGTVAGSPIFLSESEYTTFVLQVDRIVGGMEPGPLPGRAVVRWTRPDRPVLAGTRVRVSGRLSPHLGVVNHGVRGMEDYYRTRGVFSQVSATASAVQVLSVNAWSPRYWASRLRQWQHDRLSRVVPGEAYPFVLGVWLGERSLINREMFQNFVYAGTAHVLAVSGVHVGLISLALNFLLQVLRLPRRPRLVLLMAAVFVFALMTGARPATVRAASMICLYHSAELFKREPDPLSTLGLSGFLFLTWNPALAFDTGFLMSFGSVGSILLFYPGMSQWLAALPAFLRLPLATTLSVQVITVPIAAWHFNTVPMLGILANLVVVPLLSVTLWISLAVSLSMAVVTPLARLLGHALLPVVQVIETVNSAVIRVPGAYTQVLRPTLVALLFYGAALCFLFPMIYEARNRRRNGIVVVTLLLGSALLWRPLWQPAVVDFIDVGRGDATFVRTPGGTTFLVDGGDVSKFTDAGERIVAPFLYANGVSRLDYVVLSHGHRDHVGGLFHILDRFPVGAVLLGPDAGERAPLETAFIEQCQRHGIPVQRLQRGDVLPARGADIRVLHPRADWAAGASENDRSLVLQVSWPGFSLLLTGDVEEKAERELLTVLDRPQSVLKVAHHGSPTSSTDDLLAALRPSLAVASMQASGARSTLMTPAMTSRYEAHGIPLLRTDWHGGVRIRTSGNGGGHTVLTARGVRGYCLSPAFHERAVADN